MFQETIIQLNNGAAVAELSAALETVVAAVRQTGKSGTITLTLKVAPASKGASNVLLIESQVKTKLPEPDRGMTIFYATEDNRLVRNDPQQQMLPLVGLSPKSLDRLRQKAGAGCHRRADAGHERFIHWHPAPRTSFPAIRSCLPRC